MVNRPPPSGGFLQWWSNDQTFFNEVVHRAQPIANLGTGLKSAFAAQREAAAAVARQASREESHRRAEVDGAMRMVASLLGQSGGGRGSGDSQAFAGLRNLMFKRLLCHACTAQSTALIIGTLPFLHFASGHTFFTQSLQERNGFLPACVHTTFQFGDTAEFTWGKRSRLRERRLWAVDEPSYFTRVGKGPHSAEASYEGFLRLSGDLLDLSQLGGQPMARAEASSSVKLEGNPSFVAKALEARFGDVLHQMPERNPNRHLLIDSIQRRLVHNAMALGRATRRKVILPKLYCWCDRFWNVMKDCRMPGVTAAQHPFPFHCPFDHLFDLEKWMHSDAPIREYSFLNASQVSESDRRDAVRLGVRGASDGSGAEPGAPSDAANGLRGATVVDPGATYGEAAAALRKSGLGSAFVVDGSARSLELLCEDLGSAKQNAEFNQIMHVVLGVAEQVRYCDEGENPSYGRGPNAYDEWQNPINCTWGFHRPPPLPERDGHGQCERSVGRILETRWREPARRWDNPFFAGFQSKRRQAWSTRDRPAYLQGQPIG